ncbi:hypothetical protein J1614_011999 [Plenodomus biglobosus]|nr:hypothetical protein J1614_011999 [Plenodomus biglobosus]
MDSIVPESFESVHEELDIEIKSTLGSLQTIAIAWHSGNVSVPVHRTPRCRYCQFARIVSHVEPSNVSTQPANAGSEPPFMGHGCIPPVWLLDSSPFGSSYEATLYPVRPVVLDS